MTDAQTQEQTQERLQKRTQERVAVIAVHGVADQLPGDTARAVAELLVGSVPGDGSEYAITSSDTLAVRVETLRPSPTADVAPMPLAASPGAAASASPADAGPAAPAQRAEPPALTKAFVQSVSSDFHRENWEAQGRRLDRSAPGALRSARPVPLENPGIELTDFLLFKARRDVAGEPGPEVYDTLRLNLRRHALGDPSPGQRVDVYEMYWADLSRLAGGVPRLLTELFTMLFRLSQLGRDTVKVAARQFDTVQSPHFAWRWLARLQTLLDWAFCKGLALLMLQLLVLTLVIVPMGLAAQVSGFAGIARQAAGFAVPAAAALWLLYRWPPSWAGRLGALAALAALLLLLWLPPPHWVVGGLWLVLLGATYDWVMRICEVRFPLTRLVGNIMAGVVLLCVVGTAASISVAPPPGLDATQDLHLWVIGALRGVELVLLASVMWWGLAGIVLFAWLAAGQAVSWSSGFEGRASVATGRLGLFTSLGSFVILVMAAWAALTALLDIAVARTRYVPVIFGDTPMGAQQFLTERYLNSTEAFSIVALLMMVMFVYLLLAFLPSLLAEMKIVRTDGQRLGRWLTFGYRYLDFSMMVIVVLAVLAAMMTGALLVAARFHTDLFARLNEVMPGVAAMSQQFLKPLIISTASAMVAFSVLGRFLSRYVPWLRAPLDVALDVDNHFREFPRQGIPRARIFSRYVALLEHVVQQGCDRIVIVAHSQGTVISAELLRYLKHRLDQDAAGDPLAALARRMQGRVHLLTLGSPLRQLYAARFPTLYRWVLHRDGLVMGPRAAHIGANRWINGYTTGDYIGRWLWSRPARAPGDVSDALVDEDARGGGCCRPAPIEATLEQAARPDVQMDVCLGAGAHTHYFEPDQQLVAGLIDRLVVT